MQKWTTKMESTRKTGLEAPKLQKSQQSKSTVNAKKSQIQEVKVNMEMSKGNEVSK